MPALSTISPATWQFNSSPLSFWPHYTQMVLRVGEKKWLSGVCFKSGFYLQCVSDFVLVFVLQQKQNRGKISTMSPQVYISSILLLIIKAVLFYNVDLICNLQTSSPLTCCQSLLSVDEGLVNDICIPSRSQIAAGSAVCPWVPRYTYSPFESCLDQ